MSGGLEGMIIGPLALLSCLTFLSCSLEINVTMNQGNNQTNQQFPCVFFTALHCFHASSLRYLVNLHFIQSYAANQTVVFFVVNILTTLNIIEISPI